MTPEIGTEATIMGREFNVPVTVVEVGQVRLEPMVRVLPVADETAGLGPKISRCFTKRKRGQWIERGEATKGGTALVIKGAP